MMANNSFTKCCFVDGELWSNATYNTSSSTRKSAMCNFETMPVLCAHLHKCTGEGSRHFSAFHYPRPRGQRVQYFVCVCVCYHKIAVKFKLSQILNKLQLTNLVILDKQWFSTRQASSCRQTWLKWQVKLKTKN